MRGSVYNLKWLLEHRGFVCVEQSANKNDTFSFDYLVLYKDTKVVSIMSSLNGITVVANNGKSADKIIINCKEHLAYDDYQKIIFYLN